MALSLINFPDWRPYSNVQPFTVRDGATYLLQLESLKDWLRDYVVPHLNSEVAGLEESWEAQTKSLIENFERISVELIDDANAIAAASKADAEAAEAAKVAAEAARDLAALYASQAEEIQDQAITGIYENEDSQFRSAVELSMQGLRDSVSDNGTDISDLNSLTTEGRLSAEYLASLNTLNILNFGVSTGQAASQTEAIKAAFDANPGRAFYFPPGDYRLDTGLVVGAENSIVLDKDARVYAGAVMDTLITYSKTITGGYYAEDKCLIGGTLDGALKASRLFSLGKVIRFTHTQTTYLDGINRGLVTEAGPGAELFAYDLRFYNTTASNAVDNVAIEANMGDSHFRDIVMRDWTVGVIDNAANRWDRVHPWVGPNSGAATQMTTRYPTSVGFIIKGSSDLFACLPDTMRTGFRFLSAGAYTPFARLLNCRATWSSDTLPAALSNANPGYVFDNQAEVGFISDRLTVTGHNGGGISFLLGSSKAITARDTYSYGYVKDETNAVSPNHSYVNGVKQGMRTFTPTIYGSGGEGAHAYISRSGRMVVLDDVVTYDIAINATLDTGTGFAGELRIGGIPIPVGASQIRSAPGVPGLNARTPIVAYVTYGGATPWITPLRVDADGNVGIDIPGSGLRGKSVNISMQLRTTLIPA